MERKNSTMEKTEKKDLYAILGLQKGASKDAIKKAYRKQVKKYHPDKGGDETIFRGIQEAYEVLSNDEKRAVYDLTGNIIKESLDTQAVEILAAEFKRTFDKLDNNDILVRSILSEVKAGLHKLIEDKRRQINYEKERCRVFTILRKRIKTKKRKYRNIAKEVIDHELQYSKNGTLVLNQDIKIIKKALSYLDYLKYEVILNEGIITSSLELEIFGEA